MHSGHTHFQIQAPPSQLYALYSFMHPQVCFVLSIYSQVWDHPLEYSWLNRGHTLKENRHSLS